VGLVSGMRILVALGFGFSISITRSIHQSKRFVSVQADLAKSAVGLISDGAGIPFK
jgi:hypothetical protein